MKFGQSLLWQFISSPFDINWDRWKPGDDIKFGKLKLYEEYFSCSVTGTVGKNIPITLGWISHSTEIHKVPAEVVLP